MAKTFRYAKNSFVTTGALKRYRDGNNLSNVALTKQLGMDEKNWNTVATWCTKCRVPKAVLDKLGLKQRNRQILQRSTTPSGGTLYVCYVGQDQEKSFKAFTQAINVDAKKVL